LFKPNLGTTPKKDAAVTAISTITQDSTKVKEWMLASVNALIGPLLEGPLMTGAVAERQVWQVVLAVGRLLLEVMLSRACLAATQQAAPSSEPLRFRLDGSYTIQQTTTLGVIRVPLFAYFDAGGHVRAPARAAVFPYHGRCRSSELALEWEARLGSLLPFQQAEEAMRFFTHDAAPVEDTTIARHLYAIGRLLDRRWTFRSPDTIRALLTDRATRHRDTGRPLLYVSTDAHALRRYVDDSTTAAWKMINGVRLWCIDRQSGGVIHLGGDFTWGDCTDIGALFASLRTEGLLPVDEALADGKWAQVVLITDGAPWIRTHVVPALPADAITILDWFHAAEHIAACAAERFGIGSPAAAAWTRRICTDLLGRPYKSDLAKTPKLRAGHTKRKRAPDSVRQAIDVQPIDIRQSPNPHGAGEHLARQLIDEPAEAGHETAVKALLGFVSNNADRMDYPAYQAAGIQIGSGAMESLHRTASQMRCKIPGARWLPDSAVATIRMRLLTLVGRWDDFWRSPRLTSHLSQAFYPEIATAAA
jgi:hypothetical protein